MCTMVVMGRLVSTGTPKCVLNEVVGCTSNDAASAYHLSVHRSSLATFLFSVPSFSSDRSCTNEVSLLDCCNLCVWQGIARTCLCTPFGMLTCYRLLCVPPAAVVQLTTDCLMYVLCICRMSVTVHICPESPSRLRSKPLKPYRSFSARICMKY